MGRFRKILLYALSIILLGSSTIYAETIGVVLSSGIPYHQEIHDALVSKLSKEGYKVNFLIQRPHPNPISWSNAVRKLIAADVDVIITYGYGATAAAVREKPSVPIVYAGSHMPFAGVKANITGMFINLPMSSILRYLRASVEIKKLGVFYCSLEDDSVSQLREIKVMAQRYGFSVKEFNVTGSADISSHIVSGDYSDALLITSASTVNSAYSTLLTYAKNKRVPSGALMTYGEGGSATITISSDPKEQAEGAALKLIEVLKGKKASNIPQSYGTKIELIFNMKDAKEIGIKIPMELITEATRIIH